MDSAATLSSPPTSQPAQRAADLLAWYDRHRRDLPWRARPGEPADPYRVWLSEIMLQQTTVATVRGYFDRFLARWPRVQDLAAASLDEVLHQWQGLGYYARARNLHACAQAVAARGGRFPTTEDGLLALPGIGAYTAAAIAAIAFDQPATVVDGNVERVIARMTLIETPLPAAKAEIRAAAARLTPATRPGDYAQAIMDLGATICTPRKPACALCPWSKPCAARAAGEPERLPLKAAKAQRPVRHGLAFWLVRPDGAVLLRRRAERGLLGGLIEIPSTPWQESRWQLAEALNHAPVAANGWRMLPGRIGHTFTHFHLELGVVTAQVPDGLPGLWSLPARLGDYALPTLMKKLAAHVLDHTGAASPGQEIAS